MKRLVLLTAMALTGCAAAAVPTPTPRTIEVPGPTQTIEVPGPTQTIEIEVASASCVDALNQADMHSLELLELVTGIYDDYLDYPDEDLEQFGARVEERLNTTTLTDGAVYFDLADECRAASR